MEYNLYVVTEEEISNGRTNREVVESAIDGGASIIQLRQKKWDKQKYREEAKKLVRLCKENKIMFVVNDYIDIALEVGADGVHLGQEDLPIADARKICGRKLLIGKSTHSLQQAIDAEKEGADYISIGPVFQTRAKPYTVGIETLRQVSRAVKIPVVAIGGINVSNIDSVMQAGARNIAVISAVVSANDVELAARRLANKIAHYHETRYVWG